MGFLSNAWLWMYVGAGLMLLELMAPGFVIFFFGLSAVTVGGLRFLIGEGFTLAWQLAAFSAFAVLYIVLLRRWMKQLFVGDSETSSASADDEFTGRRGVVTQAIEPPETGRVMVGDAEWTAESEVPLAVGAAVKVESRRNLTLKVR